MVQFLSTFFFFISSIFVGYFKSSRFLCHPVHVYRLHTVNKKFYLNVAYENVSYYVALHEAQKYISKV